MRKTPNKKGSSYSGSKDSSPGSLLSPGVQSPTGAGSSPFRDLNTNGSCNFNVLFQARLSTSEDSLSCPPNAALLSTSDMKRMKLIWGSCLVLQIAPGNTILLRAIPSQKTQSGCIVLNRFWQENFSDKNRKVCAIGDFGRTIFRGCSDIEFSMSIEDIALSSSVDFISFCRHSLGGLSLAVGNSFSLSWKSQAINLTVVSINGKSLSDGTDISRCDGALPSQERFVVPVTAAIRIRSPSTRNDSVKLSMNDILAMEDSVAEGRLEGSENNVSDLHGVGSDVPVLPFFGGYESSVREAWSMICRGLEIGHYARSAVDNAGTASLIMKPPRGILIYGQPGSGKSVLMRKLAAAACVGIEELSHSVVLSSVVGEAEVHMRRTFERAKGKVPCIVLIDDIECLCPHRTSDSSTATEVQQRLTSCLLSLLDGASSLDRVFVIATSSYPSKVDQAMRRPGRLEKEIELYVPDPIERESIISNILKFMNISITDRDGRAEQEIIRSVAKNAHGMVAGDLLLLCKEAFAIASLRCFSGFSDFTSESTRFHVEAEDLRVALDRVVPSGIKEVAVDVPSVKWTDIGGMEDVKRSLREVVEWPLKYPELFASFNLPPPRGVLLYGPPGCSKTLMAKALATESGMNFLAVRGPELLSKWVGDSEKAVQTLFRRARAVSPSIVFFDEIDALATKRGSSSAGVNDRVLAQLLTELDGPQNKGAARVVVVAATNRPDILDAALLRPGRIDRKIYVPPPDLESRQQIFEVQLRKIPHEADVDIHQLAALSVGFSGAEVVSACNEAAILAIQEGLDEIKASQLVQAVQETVPQITNSVLEFYNKITTDVL